MKILTILAPGFEETEAVAVIDILRRAGIDVTVSGLHGRQITGSHGLVINCETVFNDVNARLYDGLFLPGGQPGTTNLENDARVIQLVQQFDVEKKWLTAICAAPRVFHGAGITKGRRITSYPSEEKVFAKAHYVQDHVAQDGHMITSRGVGTAVEFGLHLVEVFCGKPERERVAEKILWTV